MSLLLLVDDVPALAEQYAFDLARLGGHETRVAAGGQEALRILASEPVDCVILDLEMPGMDGFGVLRQLAHRGLDVPVIVYTGTGNFERCVQAVRLGGHGLHRPDGSPWSGLALGWWGERRPPPEPTTTVSPGGEAPDESGELPFWIKLTVRDNSITTTAGPVQAMRAASVVGRWVTDARHLVPSPRFTDSSGGEQAPGSELVALETPPVWGQPPPGPFWR